MKFNNKLLAALLAAAIPMGAAYADPAGTPPAPVAGAGAPAAAATYADVKAEIAAEEAKVAKAEAKVDALMENYKKPAEVEAEVKAAVDYDAKKAEATKADEAYAPLAKKVADAQKLFDEKTDALKAKKDERDTAKATGGDALVKAEAAVEAAYAELTTAQEAFAAAKAEAQPLKEAKEAADQVFDAAQHEVDATMGPVLTKHVLMKAAEADAILATSAARDAVKKAEAKLATATVTGADVYPIDEKAEKNKQDIEAHAHILNDHATLIDANTKAVGEQATKLADHEKAISANAMQNLSNANAIGENKQALAKNEEAIVANAMQNLKNANDIGKNSEAIQKNSDKIAANETAIAGHADRITAAEANVAGHETRITDNANAIEALNKKGDANEAALAKANARINDVDEEMKRGLAMQAALSGLFQPYNVGKYNVTAAVGGYKSEQAIAIGTGYRYNDKFAVKAGVATSLKNASGLAYHIGANYEF